MKFLVIVGPRDHEVHEAIQNYIKEKEDIEWQLHIQTWVRPKYTATYDHNNYHSDWHWTTVIQPKAAFLKTREIMVNKATAPCPNKPYALCWYDELDMSPKILRTGNPITIQLHEVSRFLGMQLQMDIYRLIHHQANTMSAPSLRRRAKIAEDAWGSNIDKQLDTGSSSTRTQKTNVYEPKSGQCDHIQHVDNTACRDTTGRPLWEQSA